MAKTKTNLFTSAAARAPKAAESPAKGTSWRVERCELNAVERTACELAIGELGRLDAEQKRLEREAEGHKARLLALGLECWCRDTAAAGKPPASPLTLVNGRSESVTYVMQDRTGSAKLTDATRERLVALLGSDETAALVEEQQHFAFDAETLAEKSPAGPLVREILGEALAKLLQDLVRQGKLTDEQAETVVECQPELRLRGKLLADPAALVGQRAGKIRELIEALGSAVTQFIRA